MDRPPVAVGGGIGEGLALGVVAPEVFGYDRIDIDRSRTGLLGSGANGEVRRGTVDGRPAVFKVCTHPACCVARRFLTNDVCGHS